MMFYRFLIRCTYIMPGNCTEPRLEVNCIDAEKIDIQIEEIMDVK